MLSRLYPSAGIANRPARRRPATSHLPAIAAALSIFACGTARAQVSVTTYHNDILRTGLNAHETALTAASVAGGSFNLQHSVSLDDQVDAQPLFVSGQKISGQSSAHNVVYVATEGNTVYAVDGATGAVLLSRNLGKPVPQSALPGQCDNNGPNIGIDSTPVLSTASNTMWVVTDTYESGRAVFRLHALDLGTLADKVAPVVISARAKLANGSTYAFNAYSARQRAALLYANNTIYVAFASYCDQRADISRGWLLGWNAASLTPLAANDLTNKTTGAPNKEYLTSIWMAGYGPATIDQNAPIFFATSNADQSGTTYNAQTNLAESIVKISPDLTQVLDHFTPSDESTLDQNDTDFGSGGVLVLPVGSGPTPRVSVGAGKDGRMFLVDRTNLGGYNPGGSEHVLGTYDIGGCWCGPAFLRGADGVGRVVSSGGNRVKVWKVSYAGPASLTLESTSPTLSTGQDGGFFTSVSSNGTRAGSAVIWAVARPTDSNPANVTLYAFDASNSRQLFSGVAGTWPNTGGDSNIVPTVANGRVYVASYKELAIFGLGQAVGPRANTAMMAAREAALVEANHPDGLPADAHAVYGWIRSVTGTTMMLEKRDGTFLRVDMAEAVAKQQIATPVAGRAALVRGRYDASGALVAEAVLHAKPKAALWKQDR